MATVSLLRFDFPASLLHGGRSSDLYSSKVYAYKAAVYPITSFLFCVVLFDSSTRVFLVQIHEQDGRSASGASLGYEDLVVLISPHCQRPGLEP